MSENEPQRFAALRLETIMSYPFPIIIGLLILFIFMDAISLQRLSDTGMKLYLPIGWDNTTMAQELVSAIQTMTTHTAMVSILNSFYLVLVIIPLLIAFNFAQSFGNGQIRTLLSCPIGRTRLLLVKSGIVFILITAALTVSSLLGLIFYYPFSIDIMIMSQLFISLSITIFLITTSCVFVAILSRSAPITAIGGIGLWVGCYVMIPTQTIPELLVNIQYPVLAAINYIVNDFSSPINYLYVTSFNDLLFGCGIALVVGLLLLCISSMMFQRLEV